MANCNSNCKCKSTPCSCADKAIPVAPPCDQGTVDCPDAEPCGEVFAAECIVYTGDTIVDVDIQKYDRLDSIIQRLVLMITNPACISPLTTCQSVVDLESSYIGPSIIKVKWLASPTATSYRVEYSVAGSGTWFSLPAILPTQPLIGSIGGLATETEYYIRVISLCPASVECTSVTISVTTLS